MILHRVSHDSSIYLSYIFLYKAMQRKEKKNLTKKNKKKAREMCNFIEFCSQRSEKKNKRKKDESLFR